ncbi:rhomboid-like protein [Mycobacterium vicinigordonae]|uniref:rhomboid-like protein n=1 Tax=Mycobacterium vicinigordonae TaxID=1719132 RepID=UPI001FE3193C|nr:rhomboid-like protein [Mycobacterium vicinigordonae]
MLSEIFTRLFRVRFTVAYMATLFGVSTTMLVLSPQAHDRLIRHASTNLHNLSHGRLGTLLGSAFVVEAGPLYFWMPFLTCLLVLAELHLHTLRLIVAFLVGHIGATLVVAAALAMSVEMGWMPWSITRASDVGMSYGALAALGALTATIPRAWRPTWVAWWISLSVTAAVVGGDFTNAGHAVAVLLGVLVSTRFRAQIHWTPLRCFMLLNSAGFGFLILAHSTISMVAGTVVAALAGLAAHLAARPLVSARDAAETTATRPLPAVSANG